MLLFDVNQVTFGNIYGHSGTDGASRNNRESFFAETVPQLLVNTQPNGCLGGDFNQIIDMKDATSNQAAKMSPTFIRLVKTFDWIDSFRHLHP